MTDSDLLARVYATVKALRDVVAAETVKFTQGQYADQYNAALDRLIADGFDVTEFKVPGSAIAAHRVQTNYVTGDFRMSEPLVDRGLLLAKVNAILTYFDVVRGADDVTFRGPRSRK